MLDLFSGMVVGWAMAATEDEALVELALRMAVNQELDNLATLLDEAPRRLRPGGRLAVISFQSTEDRMVKQAFRSAEQTGQFQNLTRKPVTPAEEELAQNPRSRSAKLRAIRKVH